MSIKVGDNVLVITGRDKGKEGKVTKTFKKDSKLIVEGINIVKKHMKPSQANETGGILEVEAPIHVSNVKKVETKVEKKATKKTTKKEEKDN